MKTVKEILNRGVSPAEYSRIPHMIYETDFNTSHPITNRIDRIDREIGEYMKLKCKYDTCMK